MGKGEMWMRRKGMREAQIARLNKTLMIVLGIGVVLTILWIVLKLTPVWWCFVVGYVIASAAFYGLAYMSILPLVPAWFRLRMRRNDRRARLVTALLENDTATNINQVPPNPDPLDPGEVYEDEMEQEIASHSIKVEVECEDMDGQGTGTLSGTLPLPGGAVADPFAEVECSLFSGDRMFIEVRWMESGVEHWHGDFV